MNIQGKIHDILPEEVISENFTKRVLVLEYIENNPEYVEYIPIEFSNKSLPVLQNFSVGQDVEIEFSVKGRKWTTPEGNVKYIPSNRGWRINPMGQVTGVLQGNTVPYQPQQQQQQQYHQPVEQGYPQQNMQAPPPPPYSNQSAQNNNESDGIPF